MAINVNTVICAIPLILPANTIIDESAAKMLLVLFYETDNSRSKFSQGVINV